MRKVECGMIWGGSGGMVLHDLIIWRRKAIMRRKAEHRMVTRMSRHQRIQHVLLFSSFIVLVLTGFALKFPDSWFANLLSIGEKVRGIMHRLASVTLAGVGTYHMFYLALTRDGRRLISYFIPFPN